MSDSEEENFNYYGTPLELYDEDAFPKKKPISVEEQVAKDAQGRRRFHGAFTGGFSAGFFNTVGSLEGWTPSEFRSSRNEKTSNVQQKPTDFMDDEDLGEFGIAPQVIQATKEYSHSNKRKKEVFSSGPIPGQPVLQSLIESIDETVGYYILKNMTHKQKKEIKQQMETSSSGQKVYGCEMPKDIGNVEEIFKEKYILPSIYKEYLQESKSNSTGLGYFGLNGSQKDQVSVSQLTMKDKNNKKLSISGQAFGVGAFEDDDEDIYAKDDMTKYDFELTSEKRETRPSASSLNEFVFSKTPLAFTNDFPRPVIPSSFIGKHNVKKSRFEPLPEDKNKKEDLPKRKDINALVRAKYLGEDVSDVEYTSSNQQHKKGAEEQREPSKLTPEKPDSGRINDQTDNQKFTASNLLFDKFVSASQSDDHTNILKSVDKTEIVHGTKEMYDAVRMKMFGPLTRRTSTWQPSSLLCKRFNVPEPQYRDDSSSTNKKRSKNLIFEYQKHSEKDLSCSIGLSTTSSFLKEQNNANEEQIKIETEKIEEKVIENVTLPSEPQNNSTEEQEQETETTEEKIIVTTDYTEKIDLSKQADLFKAVFLSSSESEDEKDDDAEQQERNSEIKQTILSDQLLPKFKSRKQGILSNIDFSSVNKPNTPSTSDTVSTNSQNENLNNETNCDKSTVNVSQSNVSEIKDDNTYGPKLPEKPVASCSLVESNCFTSKSDEEWIEKGEKEKRHKHKKKKKKEKHKYKHKSKHK